MNHRALTHPALIAPALLALGLSTGCDSVPQLRTWCGTDEDCPPGMRCDRLTGLCLCAGDEVCAEDEYCGPDGLCHRRLACETNLDCPEGSLCDTTTGNCIDQGKCTDDKQCPFGQICSTTYFQCVPGCRLNGDCPLGQVCRDGTCHEGLCEDDTFCGYGQLCDPQTEACLDDDRGPYCLPCQPGTIDDPYRCGPGPNFCVMTGNDPSLPPFCGVDCGSGQPCPNGFDCSLILVAPGGSCREDLDCESSQCHVNEGDEVGFCLCAADAECPQDSCDDFVMQCRLTRRPCSLGGGECDRPIYCIDGLCLIGRNCTPVEGLRCEDVL